MRRARAFSLVLLVMGALAAACTHSSGFDFPPPPSTSPDESTTVPDYSSVKLASVPGRTTTSIDNSPGQASIAGTVVAPEGAVPGAMVHVERLVDQTVLAVDVATNPDGTWNVQSVKGGVYRIRAWRAPDLAMTTPVVFFLNGNEQKTGVTLQVAHYTGTNVTAAVAPNPPVVGDPTNLAVQVTAVAVDPGGVVRATPQVGVQVDLQGGGGAWQTQSPISATTDVNGEAFWRVTCTATGSQPLAAAVGGTSYPLNLPPCQLASDTGNVTSTTSFSRSTTTTR